METNVKILSQRMLYKHYKIITKEEWVDNTVYERSILDILPKYIQQLRYLSYQMDRKHSKSLLPTCNILPYNFHDINPLHQVLARHVEKEVDLQE